MKKYTIFVAMLIAVALFLSACTPFVSNSLDKSNNVQAENSSTPSDISESGNRFPDSLIDIPANYLSEAEQQGTLQDLYYDTYESFSYEEKSQKLEKHAVIYLPYGYDENKKYPVFYLMHGGWSNEYAYLGKLGIR